MLQYLALKKPVAAFTIYPCMYLCCFCVLNFILALTFKQLNINMFEFTVSFYNIMCIILHKPLFFTMKKLQAFKRPF